MLGHRTIAGESPTLSVFTNDEPTSSDDSYDHFVHHRKSCSFLTQVIRWIQSLPHSWDDYRRNCRSLCTQLYRSSSFLNNDYTDRHSHLLLLVPSLIIEFQEIPWFKILFVMSIYTTLRLLLELDLQSFHVYVKPASKRLR